MAKKKKAAAKKERKKATKHPVSAYKLYDGNKLRNPICPKCGPGVRMALHKNRASCGKCGYTTFKSEKK